MAVVSLEEGLVAFLAADTAIVALIPDGVGGGIRLFPEMAPQGTPLPYATYQTIDEQDEHSLLSSVDFPVARVQIDCVASDPGGHKKAKALAKIIKNSQGGVSSGHRLKEFRGSMGGVDVRGGRLELSRSMQEDPADGSEFPTRRVSMDFMFSYLEQ